MAWVRLTSVPEVNASAPFSVIEGGAEPVPREPSGRQTLGDFRVPYGYEIWGDGTYKIEEAPDDEEERRREPSLSTTPTSARRRGLRIVTRRPLWIRQFGQTVDTEDELVQLAFFDAFGSSPRLEWVTRAQMSDRRQIVALANLGLPVRTGNAQIVEEYLDKALHENAPALPRVQMGTRSGAYEVDLDDGLGRKGWGWLLGRSWIGPAGTGVEPDPRADGGHSKGYSLSGLEDAWFAKFRDVVSAGPIPRWLCFSTFAAPLLRFIKHRTFIIHHWGDSGSGKTALMKFAMSAWGDPHTLTATFNRTDKSFTEIFKYSDDLTVAFDELQASTNDDHAQVIYALCLEKGRGRATKTGGLHSEIDSWRAVIRMTGEEPIIGNGRIDLGGQSNRVLQLNAPALDSASAEAIHQWMEGHHHGWGGFRFIEHLRDLVRDPRAVHLLCERHRAIRDKINKNTEGLRSRSSALAAIALAQMLAAQWFFGATRDQALHGAIADAIHVAQLIAADQEEQMTVVERALQLFRDHREANRKRWIDAGNDAGRSVIYQKTYQELFGIESAGPNADELWLVGTEANKLLRKEGLPPSRVWVDMRREGVLRIGDKGTAARLSPVRKFGKFRNRVYVIRQDRFDLADE